MIYVNTISRLVGLVTSRIDRRDKNLLLIIVANYFSFSILLDFLFLLIYFNKRL